MGPRPTLRWVTWVIVCSLYGVRVYLVQGFYVITYGLCIFLLNLFIGFLTPRDDPALKDILADSGGPSLPRTKDEEFRPFVRRVPEYRFWLSAFRSAAIALFLTLFSVFDVPVFWPILLIYFCILFFLTMKRQFEHMLKYKYIPFSWGKKKYQNVPPVVSKKEECSRAKKPLSNPKVLPPIRTTVNLKRKAKQLSE